MEEEIFNRIKTTLINYVVDVIKNNPEVLVKSRTTYVLDGDGIKGIKFGDFEQGPSLDSLLSNKAFKVVNRSGVMSVNARIKAGNDLKNKKLYDFVVWIKDLELIYNPESKCFEVTDNSENFTKERYLIST